MLEVNQLCRRELEEFYGMHSLDLLRELGVSEAPFGGMAGVVKAGTASTRHFHHESEVFLVLDGEGSIEAGGTRRDVRAGCVFRSAAFDNHCLRADKGVDLVVASFWWDDQQARRAAAVANDVPKRVIITATPPTPNGDLHLGHLSGPFLAGDVLARALRAEQAQVKTICGIDDHQSYVPLKATSDTTTPEAVRTRFGERIEAAWRSANIVYDAVIKPSAPGYVEFVQSFFETLLRKGFIHRRERKVLHCSSTGRYLFEAHLRGRCPHCGEESDGSACEACGLPNQCADLLEARSKYGSGDVEERTVVQLVLPLEKHRDFLKAHWESIPMKPRMRQLCQRLLKRELPEIAVSHPTDWGVPCTIPGFEEQVYYVWAEMAAGFSYALEKCLPTDFNHGQWEFVQCFGFDNGNFYALLFPILWHGARPEQPPVTRFITNEFLLLDGLKFSTSRGHAIWGLDFLRARSADKARFYLARSSPEEFQANFDPGAYEAFHSAFWLNELHSWLVQLSSQSILSSRPIPAPGAWTSRQLVAYREMESFAQRVRGHFHVSEFSLHRACTTIESFVQSMRRFGLSEGTGSEPGSSPDEHRTAVQLQLGALAYLAVALSPLTPSLAMAMWDALAKSGSPNWADAEGQFLDARAFNLSSMNHALVQIALL